MEETMMNETMDIETVENITVPEEAVEVIDTSESEPKIGGFDASTVALGVLAVGGIIGATKIFKNRKKIAGRMSAAWKALMGKDEPTVEEVPVECVEVETVEDSTTKEETK